MKTEFVKYTREQRSRAEGLGQRLIAIDITGGGGNLTYKGPEATSEAIRALMKFAEELGYVLKPKRVDPPLTIAWNKLNNERSLRGYPCLKAPEFRGGSPYE